MKEITKKAWLRIHEKACEVANASSAGDAAMVVVHTARLLSILDELEREFGLHPEFYDTRADFIDDPDQRMELYRKALVLARQKGDVEVEQEILESISNLRSEIQSEED